MRGEAEVLRVEAEAIQKLLLRYSWFKQFFPELKEKEAPVVRNPFSTAWVVSDILDELQDHFYNLQNDSSARDVFQEMALSQLWFAMREFFPQVSKLAFRILLPFATTYLCESDFSALVHIKKKVQKLKMTWDWFYQTLNHESLKLILPSQSRPSHYQM